MKQLVEINLTTKTAKNWTPPEIRFGETFTLAMRFFQNIGEAESETWLNFATIKAAIGAVDARPLGGEFKLKLGNAAQGPSNTTAAIDYNASASQLRGLCNAVADIGTYGAARVVAVDGSWLIFFGDQSAMVPLTVVDNGLWPISYGRVNAWQVDGKWVHELRLVQAPVAFTSASEISLPKAPTVTRLQEGGCDPSNTTCWNEIQQLYVPPEFRGTYTLRFGYAKTTQLSPEDGIEEITEALQALGKDCFKVTLPLPYKPTIEFVGDFGKLPMELLTAPAMQAPPGDLTFTLDMDRAELAAMLRREEAVTLPLEIRVTGEDENGFEGEICALSLPVVVRQPVIFGELESVPIIDLLRPHSPKSYVPFGENNILTGQHYYTENVGNGSQDIFVVAHGLDTEAVFVFARENISGGAQLIEGTDYSVTIDNANQITLTALGTPPATDTWTVIVMGASTAAAWAEGLTVTVPQVIAGGGYPSLPDIVDNLWSRVDVLEAVLPSTGPAAAVTQESGMTIELPTTQEILFFKGAIKDVWSGENGIDASKLGRAPLMLPAVHDATVTSYTTGDLPAIAAGEVWSNDSAGVLDMGRGIYGGRVPVGGHFASDGRVRYAVTQSGTSTSYFPVGFQRELWRIFISAEMLRLNRTLDVQFGLGTRLVGASSNAQWMLVVEKGTAPSQSTPATTGTNLENVVWNATPILSQRLILTGNRQTHSFGARIKRQLVSLADTLTLDTMCYGVWEGNDAGAPATANFALRARLINFDTENALASDARGWVSYEMLPGGEEGVKARAIII